MHYSVLRLFILVCASLLLGCIRKATSNTEAASPYAARAEVKPMINTFIFAERTGSDTLILLNAIQSEGYLKANLSKREAIVPPNNYRLSFISPAGDTIAQSINPSARKERLESPQPDGSINSVDVEHEEGVFVVRCRHPDLVAIAIERTFEKGAPQYVQYIHLSSKE